jgi:thioredoxin-related protein
MMRSITAWAWILACAVVLSGPARAADGLVAAKDFQADARVATQRRIPLLVVFTSPGCGYCDRVKREYLVPMHKDPAYRDRVIIRELSVDAGLPLVDFAGARTTQAAFAASQKVFMVPTVKVYDARGNAVGDPLVGLLSPDYYFGYLEAAIDEGLRKVRAH